MMQYEPSPYTALSIYMFAVAHHFNVAVNAIEHPGMLNIKETKPGRFLIRIPTEHTDHVPVVHGSVVCTYQPDTELWQVKLPSHEVLVIRNDGDHFTVVG